MARRLVHLCSMSLMVWAVGCNDSTQPAGGPAAGGLVALQGVVAFATTNGPIHTMPIGSATSPTVSAQSDHLFPVALMFSPNGQRAFLVTDNVVETFDTATGQKLNERVFPHTFWDAAISASGQSLYLVTKVVTNPPGARLIEVNAGSLAVMDSVVFDWAPGNQFEPIRIGVTADGGAIYLGVNGGLITVLMSTSPLGLVDTLDVGSVVDIVMSADGTIAYMVSDEVVALSTATHAILDTLPKSGLGHFGLAVAPSGDRAYMFEGDTTTTSVFDTTWMDIVDLSTNTVTGNLPLVGTVREPVISPDGQTVYVMSESGVFVISLQGAPTLNSVSVQGFDGGTQPAINP